MKKILMVFAIVQFTGCAGFSVQSTEPDTNETLARLGTQGPQFGPIADSTISSTLSIEGCPQGYRAERPNIQVHSSQDVRDDTGRVTWDSNAGGSRTHRCVPDPAYENME